MTNSEYSDVTPQIHALAQKMTHNSVIDPDLYSKYNVKRGLRDLDGKGVLTGLTDISTITQNKLVDGKLVPCEGELRYRGYNVKDIVDAFLRMTVSVLKRLHIFFSLAICLTKNSLKILRSFSFSTEPFLSTLFVMLSSRPQVTI